MRTRCRVQVRPTFGAQPLAFFFAKWKLGDFDEQVLAHHIGNVEYVRLKRKHVFLIRILFPIEKIRFIDVELDILHDRVQTPHAGLAHPRAERPGKLITDAKIAQDELSRHRLKERNSREISNRGFLERERLTTPLLDVQFLEFESHRLSPPHGTASPTP